MRGRTRAREGGRESCYRLEREGKLQVWSPGIQVSTCVSRRERSGDKSSPKIESSEQRTLPIESGREAPEQSRQWSSWARVLSGGEGR